MKKQKNLSWSFSWRLLPLIIIYTSSLGCCALKAAPQSQTTTLNQQKTPAAPGSETSKEEEEIDYSEMIFEEYWEDLAYFKETKEKDPFAPYNKFMAALAFVIDIIFCKGLAQIYVKVFPQIVRTAVGNFIQNTCELRTSVNDLLQKKPKQAVKSTARFLINSIFGCCGLFDVAKKAKIKVHNNDFGMTLGTRGVGCGPFLMKLSGPSTFRDFLAGFVDVFIDPFHLTYLLKELRRSWPLYALLKMAHERSKTLKYTTQAKNAKNPYELMKIAHLQTREYKIAQKRFEMLQKRSRANKTSTK